MQLFRFLYAARASRWYPGLISIPLLGCTCLAGLLFFCWRLIDYPPVDLEKLLYFQPGTPTVVLDRHGTVITQFATQRRSLLDLADVHEHLVHAFLAAEDRAFFRHHGFNILSIFRSLYTNIRSGRTAQGGSTITQQLVKLVYTDQARTYTRKLKELWITLSVERALSKDQILQAYFNQVYCGSGIYGIKAAAHFYFGVEPAHLSLAQCATLAGSMKNPEHLCPATNPEGARLRRNTILQAMRDCGYIDAQACADACAEPLVVVPPCKPATYAALRDALRTWVMQRWGKKMLYEGGLVIQTTLDLNVMERAQQLLRQTCDRLSDHHGVTVDGGLMVMDGTYGAIRAYVAGADPCTMFDRVSQAQRQLGSLLKPLVYYAAIEGGARMDDVLLDEPINITIGKQVWSPANHHRKFMGQVTRAYGLTRSLNTCAVHTLLTAGIDKVVDLIDQVHLARDVPPYPSLALGCLDVTVLRGAAYFNLFAHEGSYVKPWYIAWVKDPSGALLFHHTPTPEPILSWKGVSQIAYSLLQGLERFRKPWASIFPQGAVLGKTGTTNDARSCWCGVATPELTCTVYLGQDNNGPLNGLSGARSALPLALSVVSTMQQQGYVPEKTTFTWHPHLQERVIAEPDHPDIATRVLVP